MCAGVEPGEAAAEDLHFELFFLKIDSVEVCYLKLSSGGRSKLFRKLYYLIVIEIEADDGAV